MPLSVSALLNRARAEQRKVAVVSLHDAPSARLSCDAGADMLLVGDSAGNTLLGYDDTLSVTLDEMVMLCAAVVRGVRKSSRPEVPVIADLPFASYASPRQAVDSGARLMRAGAGAVKMEGGGKSVRKAARALAESGIPVVGHLGYTPQFARGFDHVVQARTSEEVLAIIEDTKGLQECGIAGLVLEAVTDEAARAITAVGVPTIGIGAGAGCDAQVLVWHDIVGITEGAPFRFVKRYAEAGTVMRKAVAAYVHDVGEGAFPTEANLWRLTEDQAEALSVDLEKISTNGAKGHA